MIAEHWYRFLSWNDAICEACFPEVEYPEPVYLDLDDDVQRAICSAMDVAPERFGESLGESVRDVLDVGRGSDRVFRYLDDALAAWRKVRRTDDPPPILPLLALLSLAAQQMAASDGLRDTNYYSRLMELLGTPGAKEEIVQAYRDHAESFWGSLNGWLQSLGGRRGTPTASQVGGHRYVGIPLSQALIRRAERQRMLRFFTDMGLPARASIPESELERLFSFWIERDPSPSPPLARLWARDSHRPRVREALKASLEIWDGRAEATTSAGDSRGRIRLTLSYSTFPRRRFSLGALGFFDQAAKPRSARIISAPGQPSVDLVPAIPGALAVGEGIDSGHLLESALTIEDDLTGQCSERLPGRLVIFRYDEASALWVETEGVLVGEELRLACRNDLFGALSRVLATSARPGWTELPTETVGVPDGWRILLDVQIFARLEDRLPPRSEELHRLDPIVTTQLLLSGGLRLPRIRAAWHKDRLPEVRALVPSAPGFQLQLFDCLDEGDQLLDEWTDDGAGQCVIDLARLDLDRGTYRMELVLAGEESASQSRTFSVHDADVPLETTAATVLVHDLDDPLTVLGVFRNRDTDTDQWHEGGETAPSDLGLFLEEHPPTSPWWSADARPAAAQKMPLALQTLDPQSCVFTGAHYWRIEQAEVDSQGKLLRAASQGRCDKCGLEKTYSNSYWRNRRKYLHQEAAQDPTAPTPGLSQQVPPVRPPEGSIPWDAFMDALAVLGGGPWSEFLALARQTDGSGPTVFHVAHTLEALGYLEIERDQQTLAPILWNVTRPVLVDTSNGPMCVGGWTPRSRRAVAAAMRATLLRHHNEALDTWYVANAQEPAPEEIPLAGPSWEPLAERLPLISDVIAALPRRPLMHTGNFQWFHVPSASWIPADSLSQTGAYRVRSFSTLDVFRGPEDAANGTMAISQVRFGKHAAAFVNSSKPLMAFDPATMRMTVPLGADLPGLYNRAVVLASGRLPHKEGRMLVYQDVPEDLANHLHYLLGH